MDTIPTTPATPTNLYTISQTQRDGQAYRQVELSFHAGQWRVWNSTARIVALVSGHQSGKTLCEPPWLWREMQRQGPGDYLVAGPTFTLLDKKVIPTFTDFFERALAIGKFTSSRSPKITITPKGAKELFTMGDASAEAQAQYAADPGAKTTIYFGYAENPNSLESATYKAAVLDEAGQPEFKRESKEAIDRRLSIHQGRSLIGTTPYTNTGWLKELWDRGQKGDPSIDCISFSSLMNPVYPRAEYLRQQKLLPAWKFALFYEGRFEKPAGLIYDNFDLARHGVTRHVIPGTWKRFLGLDFGGVNTAGVFAARDPQTRQVRIYRIYHAGHRTAAQHVAALLAGESSKPLCIGGAKSEGQWREEFAAAGLPVLEPPVSAVEAGINRVYSFFAGDRLGIFDDLAGLLDDLTNYARVLDPQGEPTEVIENKEQFHLADALRYLLAYLSDDVPWVAPPARVQTTPSLIPTIKHDPTRRGLYGLR